MGAVVHYGVSGGRCIAGPWALRRNRAGGPEGPAVPVGEGGAQRVRPWLGRPRARARGRCVTREAAADLRARRPEPPCRADCSRRSGGDEFRVASLVRVDPSRCPGRLTGVSRPG